MKDKKKAKDYMKMIEKSKLNCLTQGWVCVCRCLICKKIVHKICDVVNVETFARKQLWWNDNEDKK